MVVPGVDRVARDPGVLPAWAHPPGRVGLLSSDASLSATRSPPATAREILLEAGILLTRLFTPEHGLSARGRDGLAQPDGRDPVTGLPVVSLYGKDLAPPPSTLQGLDGVLVDLQDAGARFYTFVWTLSHLMESCAEAGLPMAILDRPNPLGGKMALVEGPIPDPDMEPDFLCRLPIPIRHSLTLGELGFLIRSEMAPGLELDVVSMQGWRRSMIWMDTGLPFHPPSPGLPAPQSLLLYPGSAFFEATNVSVGRGTPLSFRFLSAPWMDVEGLAIRVEALGEPGLKAEPHSLGPDAGVRLTVTGPGNFRPVRAGLRILALVRTLCPTAFRWQSYPTAANPTGAGHLSRLLRSRALVAALEQNPEVLLEGDALRRGTTAEGWADRVRLHQLYA